MGITIDSLCNSCTNIGCEFQSGIVRTKCAFYMPPHIEPDNCGNYVVTQPTVNAIPLSVIEDIKAEIRQGVSDFANENGDIAYGFVCAEEIIDKHIAERKNHKNENIGIR